MNWPSWPRKAPAPRVVTFPEQDRTAKLWAAHALARVAGTVHSPTVGPRTEVDQRRQADLVAEGRPLADDRLGQ